MKLQVRPQFSAPTAKSGPRVAVGAILSMIFVIPYGYHSFLTRERVFIRSFLFVLIFLYYTGDTPVDPRYPCRRLSITFLHKKSNKRTPFELVVTQATTISYRNPEGAQRREGGLPPRSCTHPKGEHLAHHPSCYTGCLPGGTLFVHRFYLLTWPL